MEPELAGEDFSLPPLQTEDSQHRRRGRPSEIGPETLRRNVIELQFVLEENWGVVGWLLLQAKNISDVQAAFRKIVNPRCGLLEPFTDSLTLETTPAELRQLRKREEEASERYRRNFKRRRFVKEKFERVFRAETDESDPVKRVQLQMIRGGLAHDYEEAESLQQSSFAEWNSLRAERRQREAHFAQSEILRFIQSTRREFTPLNVARAMAGLPFNTARISCERCTRHDIDLPHGLAFQIFQAIESVLQEPISDLGGSIDSMRDRLLKGRGNKLPAAAELRRNWYFLESAIRSAARDVVAPRGSIVYRVFAKYCTTSTSHSVTEATLAEAQRLLKDGEDP